MLHNELDNKFLLSAKKKMLSKTTHYIISDSAVDINKDSVHYVAKLKGNFKRTSFVLSDTRILSGNQEIAFVDYSKNVLPRELHVAIKNPDIKNPVI
jgi:hypothetical protein